MKKKLTAIILTILMVTTTAGIFTACKGDEQLKVTYTTDGNGTIQGQASQTITKGKDGSTVTAMPNNGYEFDKWEDNNSTNATRTDTNITKNITAKATFKLVEETGLTAEQQVAEIKRINDGAYNAYFNKVTQNPQRMSTYSEEDDRTEWFETWFKVVSGVVAAIIEEKQTDVLTESYTFLDAANIASGITAVFTEREGLKKTLLHRFPTN